MTFTWWNVAPATAWRADSAAASLKSSRCSFQSPVAASFLAVSRPMPEAPPVMTPIFWLMVVLYGDVTVLAEEYVQAGMILI